MLFVNLNAGMGVHQIALADAMYSCLGDNFKFVEFGIQSEELKNMHKEAEHGIDYSDRPYIINMHASEKNMALAMKLIDEADAMRVGGEPFGLIKQRLINCKLTFRSSERIFKKRRTMLSPRGWKYLYEIHRKYENPNYRLLCQSAYLANDMSLLRAYSNRMYKFAYYTQQPQLCVSNVIKERRNIKIQLLWCARFIDWKHPKMMIALAQKMIKSGRQNFHIKMIGGITELWHQIKKDIQNKNLEFWITLTGGLSNEDVLKTMRDSHIFVFTSDRNEGWGAVLNEAMGAGCACVASHEIGATPYLIEDGYNGFVFKSKSLDSLFGKVCSLYDNIELREKFSISAYETMAEKWSAHTAAQRLITMSESILLGKEIMFEDGPCSIARPINKYNELFSF